MSRDWCAVHGRLLRLPKYRDLPEPAQLSLVYTWLLAGDQTPEATWRDVASLRSVLRLNGRPPEDVDTLLATGWLDTLEDGRIAVHDWDEWQYAATTGVRRTYEADRKREWRAHRNPPHPPKEQDTTGQDKTGVRDTQGQVPDASRTSPGNPPGYTRSEWAAKSPEEQRSILGEKYVREQAS